jgi:hypothetical protein
VDLRDEVGSVGGLLPRAAKSDALGLLLEDRPRGVLRRGRTL